MQYLESNSSNLEIQSMTNRKPTHISKNRRNAAKRAQCTDVKVRRQYVAIPGQECKSELIVGAGLEHIRWTAWYFQF